MAKRKFKPKQKNGIQQENQNITNDDTSPYIHQRDKISKTLTINNKAKLTTKQEDFLKLCINKTTKIVFVSGPAGCSKTFMSVLASLHLLNDKKVSDVLYVRSVVESADSKIGYLKGSEEDKLAPYLTPLLEKLSEFLDGNDIAYLQKDERITGTCLSFLRGSHFAARSIISDESQNMTKKELITLITRMGNFSKLYVCGDPEQSDIGNKSGFIELFNLFNDDESKENGIYCFEFTEEDIVRSELVKYIVKKLKTCAINKDKK